MPTPHDYYHHGSHEPHLHNRHNGAPYIEPDWQANLAKDQLPDLSTIGRGPRGEGVYMGQIETMADGIYVHMLSDLTGESVGRIGPFPVSTVRVYGEPQHTPVAGEQVKIFFEYTEYNPDTKKNELKTQEFVIPAGAMGSLIYLYPEMLDRTSDDTYQIDEKDLTIYNRKKYPEKPAVRVNDIVILETHKKIPSDDGKKHIHKYYLTFGTVEAAEKGKVIFTARTFFEYNTLQLYYDSILDAPFAHDDDNEDIWIATGTLNIWESIGDRPTKVSQFENDANYQNKEQVDTAIQAAIVTTYRYKGSVDTWDELPENPENGWVFEVKEEHNGAPANTNWAWNEDEQRWDELGGTIDWNGIATEEYVNAKVSEGVTEAKAYMDAKTEGLATVAFTGDYDDLKNKPLVKNIDPDKYIPDTMIALVGGNYSQIELFNNIKSIVDAYMSENGLTEVFVLLNGEPFKYNGDVSIFEDGEEKYNQASAWTELKYVYEASGRIRKYLLWDNINHPDFADIAFTGSWNDLQDVPDLTVTWDDVQGKPTFSAVATSGSYNDLADKPNLDQYQTDAQVTQAIQQALDDFTLDGFLKRVDLKESEYEALDTKDHDTIYVVEPTPSKAFACLDSNGTLTFFRSFDEFPGDGNRIEDATMTDVAGNVYEGILYRNYEELTNPMHNDWPWWPDRTSIIVVTTVDGQAIAPMSASHMFYYVNNMTTANLGKNFDASNITDMSYMFHFCEALTNLDLSSFDTSNVTDMSYMFYSCRSLTTIYASDWYNSEQSVSSIEMFSDCIRLPDYNATQMNWGKALIQPDGYFTDPADKPTN